MKWFLFVDTWASTLTIVAFESLARWQQGEQAVSGMVIVFKCPRSAEETPHLISIIDPVGVITHPSLPVFNCSHPIPVNDLHSLDAFYCFCVKGSKTLPECCDIRHNNT